MITKDVQNYCTNKVWDLASLLCLSFSFIPLHSAVKDVVPGDIPELLKPKYELIHEESLQDAMKASVRSGALFLLEEMLAPGNDSKLFYPPHSAIKKIGEKVVERRYKKEKRPIYEKKKVPKLVPKRDDYGSIIGYEKKMVEVRASDRIIGYKDVEVADPEGDIVRKITVPILDRSNKMLPRGWFGINAQGIIILTRCGLGKSGQVREAANELERMMNAFGTPDATWDQAWLAMAWMELAEIDSNRAERRDRLIGRLIDGATISGGSKNPGFGLWGPISIHHESLSHLFRVELELQDLFTQTETALENAPKNRKKKLQAEFTKISTALGEVKKANRQISQQGKRLSDIERPWKMDETYSTSGLSYYLYNRDITDIDSSAIAAMALYEAKKRDLIPEVTPRDKIQGKTLVKGVKSQSVFNTAYKSLFKLPGEEGNFASCTNLFPLKAYDKIPNLAGVPLKITLPTLLDHETWHSNTSALAAMHFMDPLIGERDKGRIRDRDEIIQNNLKRCKEIIKAYLAVDPHFNEWAGPHAGEEDSLKALNSNSGWPVLEKKKKRAAAPAIKDLSVGYLRSPRALLQHLQALQLVKEQDEVKQLQNAVAYRLLLEQATDGAWHSVAGLRVGTPSLSSGEWTYLLGKLAQRHLWQVKDDQSKKPAYPLNEPFKREGPYPQRHSKKIRREKYIWNVVFEGEGNAPRRWGHGGYSYHQANQQLTDTMATLLYLGSQLKEYPVIDIKEPLAILSRSQAAKTEFEQALLDLQEAEITETFTEAIRDKKIKELETEGPTILPSEKDHRNLMHEVWRRILLGSGLQDKLQVLEPEEEPEAESTEGKEAVEDEAAEGEAKEEAAEPDEAEEAKSALDNILGGDD